MKIMSTLYFVTPPPYGQIMTPNQKLFATRCLMREGKKSGGGGGDRIGLTHACVLIECAVTICKLFHVYVVKLISQ